MSDINEKWAGTLRTGRQNPAEMPSGGAAADVLTKASAAPYDAVWKPPAGGSGSSSGSSGAVQTSDGAGGFANVGTLPSALAALSVPVSVGPYSIDELVAGLNALLLYLGISPAILVDNDGNPLVDQNGNLIIG